MSSPVPQNSRIDWLDQCKGIGMLLVVFGHVMTSGPLYSAIFLFHMPLFFILSGFLFEAKKFRSTEHLLANRGKRLGIPYIFIGIAAILYTTILAPKSIQLGTIERSALGHLLSIRGYSSFHGAMWFIGSLFSLEILVFLLSRTLKRQTYILLAALVISFLAVKVSSISLRRLPLSFDISLCAVIFHVFGSYLKSNHARLSQHKTLVLVSSLALFAICLTLPDRFLNMYCFSYPNFFIYLLGPISGSMVIVTACMHLPSLRPLCSIGKYSLGFLMLHQWLSIDLANKFSVFLLSYFNESKATMPLTNVGITFLVAVTLTWLFCAVLERIWPQVIAMPRRMKVYASPKSGLPKNQST